jgi:thiol-disulfide isomerase/thioredoxin
MKKTLLIWTFLLLITLLSGCEKRPETYKDLKDRHIEHWDQVDDVITDGMFILYYYSPFCPDCKSIESFMVDFIFKHRNEYTILLMISMDVESQGTPPIQLRGVPALFIYQDKVFVEMILGPGNVKSYMENLKS